MKLGKQERIGLAALGAVALVVIVWFVAFWRPEGSSLRTAQKNEAQAAAQVSSDEAQIATLRADAPKVKKEKAVLQKLVQEVPDGPSLDQMLVTINRAASAAGITLVSVGTPEPSGWATSSGPSAPAAATGPDSLSLALGVSGSQPEILRFVSTLDAQPRLYVVNSFSLTRPTNNGAAVSTSLTVETFFQSAASNNPTFPGN